MAKKATEAPTLTLKPLDDRVVVQQTEAEEKTAGGILLPDTAKQKPQQGKVVAVGPGKLSEAGTRLALAVKIGAAKEQALFGGMGTMDGGELACPAGHVATGILGFLYMADNSLIGLGLHCAKPVVQ